MITRSVPWKKAWTGCILIVTLLRLIYAGIGLWVVNAGGPIPLQETVYGEIRPFLHSDFFSRNFVNPWFGWDTITYLKIAIHGYGNDATIAFMPLYPLMIRLLTPLSGGNYLLAALLVSTVCAVLALILLFELFLSTYTEDTAWKAVFTFLSFPTAFFLLAGYTESLFITLVLAFWLLARKGHWVWAGLVAGLATLTRLQGVVLSAVMLWMILSSSIPGREVSVRAQIRQVLESLKSLRLRSSIHPTAWLAVPIPLIFSAVYQFCLWDSGYGTIPDALRKYWHLESVPPWTGFILFLQRLPDRHFNYMDWIDLALFIVILIASLIGLRRLDPAFSVYTWLTIAVLLTRGTPPHLLASYSRYFLTLFPLAALPALTHNRYLHIGILVISFSLQILLASIFLWGSWVA